MSAAAFEAYPPEARALATRHADLLRALPPAFAPLLLREVIAYDWRFPAERREIDSQFAFLRANDPAMALAAFAALRLTPELQGGDWIAAPAQFAEQLTAHLWATGQIDAFRTAAMEYMSKVRASMPRDALAMPRLVIVVFGRGVNANRYPLFRRLRAHGIYYRRVMPDEGWHMARDAVAARAEAQAAPYAHWYVDGLACDSLPGATCVSWDALGAPRRVLLEQIRRAKQSGTASEALRSALAQMHPRVLGLADGILDRFAVSLLTEGSGTQLYSTTFVQWTVREVLRRAQPLTLVARYAPRIGEVSLGELVANPQQAPAPDAQGSLIDADMGAWYAWLSLQRLDGAGDARFLAWFENSSEALAVAPPLRAGTVCDDRVDLRRLLEFR